MVFDSVERSVRVRFGSMVVSVLLVVASVVVPAAPALAQSSFVIRGHGFGHGIGLSQYGAKGLAEHGWSYADILAHYYQGTSLRSLATEPVVRVALQKTDVPQGFWTIRGNNADVWVDYPGRTNSSGVYSSGGYLVLPKGQGFTICPLGSTTGITIRDQSSVVKAVIAGDWVQAWERDTTKPRYLGLLQIAHESGPFSRPNILYPGSVKFQRGTTATTNTLLHARNYVYMEDYVRCVVPRESPASWAREALKAQAVAARSYAYVGLSSSASFDVWCTTSSQVYNGWGQWDSSYGNVRHGDDAWTTAKEGDWLSDPAVEQTARQLVSYGSTIVKTYFHSTSGGHTEDIDKAWPSSSAQPYYQGVPDPYEHLAGATYEDWGPWTYTADEVRTKLISAGVPASSLPSAVTDMRVAKRGDSGRVMELVLYGPAGESPKTLSGSTSMTRVRNALCAGKDTWFYVDPKSVRISGGDRYATSVKLSASGFQSASAVVVASGSSYADALAASGLAGTTGAPVLLVSATSAPSTVLAEIQRLGATKAYIVGGTSAVSDSVVGAIRSIPALAAAGRVERVAGANRYETAAKVALRIQSLKGGAVLPRVVIVSGTSFADAVAVAPLAYRKGLPVLLVNTSGVPVETRSALGLTGATKILCVGGEAVVPSAVLVSAGIPYTRIAAGTSRYDTAAKLADYMVASEGFTWDNVHVANGVSLVDALAAGPFAGKKNGPLLFATTYAATTDTTAQFEAHKGIADHAYLIGGASALNNVVEAQVEQSLQ